MNRTGNFAFHNGCYCLVDESKTSYGAIGGRIDGRKATVLMVLSEIQVRLIVKKFGSVVLWTRH